MCLTVSKCNENGKMLSVMSVVTIPDVIQLDVCLSKKKKKKRTFNFVL